MKKVNLLWLMVGLLLLLNTGTLVFLFMTRHGGNSGGQPGGPQPHSPAAIITEKLSLDDQQQERYRQIREAHQDTMQVLQEEYNKGIRQYFGLLGATYTPDQKAAAESRLTAIQQQRVDVTFRHFEALKSICTPEQQGRFADIMPEIANVIIAPRPKGRPGHHP